MPTIFEVGNLLAQVIPSTLPALTLRSMSTFLPPLLSTSEEQPICPSTDGRGEAQGRTTEALAQPAAVGISTTPSPKDGRRAQRVLRPDGSMELECVPLSACDQRVFEDKQEGASPMRETEHWLSSKDVTSIESVVAPQSQISSTIKRVSVSLPAAFLDPVIDCFGDQRDKGEGPTAQKVSHRCPFA